MGISPNNTAESSIKILFDRHGDHPRISSQRNHNDGDILARILQTLTHQDERIAKLERQNEELRRTIVEVKDSERMWKNEVTSLASVCDQVVSECQQLKMELEQAKTFNSPNESKNKKSKRRLSHGVRILPTLESSDIECIDEDEGSSQPCISQVNAPSPLANHTTHFVPLKSEESIGTIVRKGSCASGINFLYGLAMNSASSLSSLSTAAYGNSSTSSLSSSFSFLSRNWLRSSSTLLNKCPKLSDDKSPRTNEMKLNETNTDVLSNEDWGEMTPQPRRDNELMQSIIRSA